MNLSVVNRILNNDEIRIAFHKAFRSLNVENIMQIVEIREDRPCRFVVILKDDPNMIQTKFFDHETFSIFITNEDTYKMLKEEQKNE